MIDPATTGSTPSTPTSTEPTPSSTTPSPAGVKGMIVSNAPMTATRMATAGEMPASSERATNQTRMPSLSQSSTPMPSTSAGRRSAPKIAPCSRA